MKLTQIAAAADALDAVMSAPFEPGTRLGLATAYEIVQAVRQASFVASEAQIQGLLEDRDVRASVLEPLWALVQP